MPHISQKRSTSGRGSVPSQMSTSTISSPDRDSSRTRTSSRNGASALHGPHQEAKKLRMYFFSAQSRFVRCSPVQ